MCKPLADPVFDIGRDLQIAYDEGYRKGRYDEKLSLEDCISRQEAIKVASGYCHPANIADELRKLPSAQEIISCKDCKHWMNEHLCKKLSAYYGSIDTDADFFCGYAERRSE